MSRRNGVRKNARTAAARHGIATMLVITRLPNSISPWMCSSGVSREPSQRGQSGQPSPEPVSRTPAPVSTISVQTPSAAYATWR